ncbi:MAG: thioredoxin domain-containing protein, partial [Gammaproteobacteria bacterium]|nr:thioredoxin domain-containing protein [Gammaproteobacteria bacterium]
MSNRLSGETSPYLRQHADNPVAWQPWDDAALAQARGAQKPILLSIGYSACHWCHVMAHESFEDPAIAQVMNDNFVNIKVDREERPDLDKVYQLAHQLLTQQGGGWPLTMFLDPDTLLPFFGGTYFPKTPRYQLPGFTDLLLRIADVFTTKRDDLNEQSERIADVLGKLTLTEADADQREDAQLLDAARDQLHEQADRAEGGFGKEPKFPMPSTLDR